MGRSNSESQDGIHKEIHIKEISDSEDHDSEPSELYSEALAVSSLVTAYSEGVKDHAYSIAVENTIHPQ